MNKPKPKTHQDRQGEFTEDNSRWNYSLQPGWTKQETLILKYALQVYGIGRWKQIDAAKVLPSKMIQQMYLQTQRMIGQQSLAEFMQLHLDIDKIAEKNRKTEGVRKMGFLVNQDDKLTKELKAQKQEENRRLYGLTPEQIEEIRLKLPPPSEVAIFNLDNIVNSKKRMSAIEKISHCNKLEEALLRKIAKTEQQY